MVFEHFAINVPEPLAMSGWYQQHLGLTEVFTMKEVPYMTFLADETGRVVMELYNNPKGSQMDYPNIHTLTFHVAFMSKDAEADKNRLVGAGAQFVEEQKPVEGTHLVMLRDPWDIPLQICQRKVPLNN